MNPYDVEKPPIGIMPEKFWKKRRAEELSCAIQRYVMSGHYNNAVFEWCIELAKLVKELEESK